jgi:hypothetical protein
MRGSVEDFDFHYVGTDNTLLSSLTLVMSADGRKLILSKWF